MKSISIFLFLLITLASNAQDNKTSGLNARQFHKYWKVESESPDYKVTFRGDTAEILSPKGLTLWRKEKMSGKVTIEYDACVVVEAEGDRLSDLNCFWMASDPQYPDNIWKREKWRNGIFLNCYSLQLYYMGYGGNHNSTTRFRRYDGNEAAVTNAKARPAILKEYTDADHLLEANKWYHIKITNENNRVSYYINGVRLVDFRDAEPLTEGWFGFRTTLSRTRIANFHYECSSQETSEIPLHWIGNTPQQNKAVSLGVPFNEGELYPEHTLQLMTDKGEMLPTDTWALAYWPDGSVKWKGIAGVIPKNTEKLLLKKTGKKSKEKASSRTADDRSNKLSLSVVETPQSIRIETGIISAYIPRQGDFLIEDQIFPISKDDLVIINPHINHTEISKGSPPLSYFTVGVDGLCFSFNGHKEYRIFNCREKKTDLLFYFNSLFQELDRQSEGYETICSHMLDILILQLRRITDSPFELITAQHPSKECAHIKRYLDSNYGENITLDHLSELSHLNKYYLSHEFTKYYGISPINYLNRKRIEVCKELLENTDYGISDIAHLTGFSSQSYLSQSFRKSCGMTAGTYRKLKKKRKDPI